MFGKSKARWQFLALSLLMTLVSFSAWAQRTDGNIGGAGVAGDQVTATNLGTGLKRVAVADEEGKYRLAALPLGDYQVVITRGDATVANVKVTVRPGATTRLASVPTGDQARPVASQPPPAD